MSNSGDLGVTVQCLCSSCFRWYLNVQRCLDGTQKQGISLNETGFQMLSYFCYLFTFWSSKERDAGIKNPHLCASKDKQLATGSLSKVKEQGYDTGVTFHIHLLQRTACIHTAELPYCHQQSYTQTDSWTQSVASVTQNVAGKGADQPRAVPWMHHNMQDEWRACYCLGPCPELL